MALLFVYWCVGTWGNKGIDIELARLCACGKWLLIVYVFCEAGHGYSQYSLGRLSIANRKS